MKKLPQWISLVLKIAGILNFLLALGLIFFSSPILASIQQESHFLSTSVLWLQLSGIGFAVLGTGYLVASFNTFRNSVALLMGIVANFFGLIFLLANFGISALSNGIILATVLSMIVWIGVLVLMLNKISNAGKMRPNIDYSYIEPLSKTLSRFRTQKGKSLLQLSNDKPVLVIFLRQFEGAFCREALLDVKKQQASIEGEGAQLVFVHLSEEEQAQIYFEKVNLEDEHRISDPNGIMYAAFGLDKEAFTQPLGWRSWVREFPAMLKGHGIRPLIGGDGLRMPGVFLINRGEIIKSYRHNYSSEKPDYVSLASSEAA